MYAYESDKDYAIYRIKQIPADNTPYHSSKTIESVIGDTVFEEADIFRKRIDDTTLYSLKMLSLWDRKLQQYRFESSFGKADAREMKLEATDYLTDKINKFPNYEFVNLDIHGIDSVLHSWRISRFDKE